MRPDLNTLCLSATLTKMPDFQQPGTFLELRVVHPDGGQMFVAAHTPCAEYLRLLEDLTPGDRLYVEGALVYARADRYPGGGQHAVKVKVLRRLDPHGRLLAPEEAGADHRPAHEVVSNNRTRRKRKRRSAPDHAARKGGL